MMLSRFKNFLLVCIPLIITALIYTFALNGPFVFDDHLNLPQVITNNFSWQNISNIIWRHHTGFIGRPVAVISFLANVALFGDTSFGFKLFNLLAHLFTGLLLFFITDKLLQQIKLAQTKLLSIAVISIWLIHPIQVSTVLYSVQRMAILATLFLTASIYCYCKLRENLKFKNQLKISWLIAMLVTFMLAIFSKENALLLPVYLLLFELIIYKPQQTELVNNNYLSLLRCLMIYLPIILGGLFLFTHFNNFVQHYNYREFNLSQRLFTESKVLCYYLRLIFLPTLAQFGLYHDDFAVLRQIDILSSIGIISLIVLSALLHKRRPLASLGIGLFLAAHLMESTIFALEIIFEHRNYFALYGICLLLADLYLLLAKFCDNLLLKRLLVSIIFLSLISLTILRVDIWSNANKLYQAHLIHHPQSVRARLDWANYLLKHDNFLAAKLELDKVEALIPNNPGPAIHKLKYYCLTKQTVDQQHMAKTIKNLKNYPEIYYFSNALIVVSEDIIQQKCQTITPKLLQDLLFAALENNAVKSHAFVSQQLYHTLARLQFYQKQYQLGFANLDRAYHIYPKRLTPLVQKALQQMLLRDFTGAQATIAQLNRSNQGNYRYNISSDIRELQIKLNQLEHSLENE